MWWQGGELQKVIQRQQRSFGLGSSIFIIQYGFTTQDGPSENLQCKSKVSWGPLQLDLIKHPFSFLLGTDKKSFLTLLPFVCNLRSHVNPAGGLSDASLPPLLNCHNSSPLRSDSMRWNLLPATCQLKDTIWDIIWTLWFHVFLWVTYISSFIEGQLISGCLLLKFKWDSF